MMVCLNCVPSVALNGAAFNPSWHLTAVGVFSSAVAVHVASRRWLSSLGRLHVYENITIRSTIRTGWMQSLKVTRHKD
jgi:hypothetical protein